MRSTRVVAAVISVAIAATGCARSSQVDPGASTPTSTACSPAKNSASGRTSETLNVDGEQRTYELDVPASYAGAKPTPVVFTFHGRGSTGSQQLFLSGMDQVGNQNNFIVVAPSAIDGQWQFPLTGSQTTADTAFLTELTTALETRLCIDKTRIYASGMSLGSAMTFVLACAKDRKFAAFGGVGASFYRQQCNESAPAPFIYFHGTADPIVPFEGGSVSGSPVGSLTARVSPATENIQKWAAHNGCPAKPSKKQIGDTTLIAWTGCTNNASVDFYRINGSGHTWPGADETIALFLEPQLGSTTQSVKASELMWKFFQGYQLGG